MSVTGDFAGLAALRDGLAALGDGAARAGLLANLAEEGRRLTRQGFRRSRDPYGGAWAPLKVRVGGRPLMDTGRLLNSLATRADAGGFWVESGVVYAATHQHGRGAIPRRQYLPEDATGGLPAAWRAAFAHAAEAYLTTLLR